MGIGPVARADQIGGRLGIRWNRGIGWSASRERRRRGYRTQQDCIAENLHGFLKFPFVS